MDKVVICFCIKGSRQNEGPLLGGGGKGRAIKEKRTFVKHFFCQTLFLVILRLKNPDGHQAR